jgi:hypothetical protein
MRAFTAIQKVWDMVLGRKEMKKLMEVGQGFHSVYSREVWSRCTSDTMVFYKIKIGSGQMFFNSSLVIFIDPFFSLFIGKKFNTSFFTQT